MGQNASKTQKQDYTRIRTPSSVAAATRSRPYIPYTLGTVSTRSSTEFRTKTTAATMILHINNNCSRNSNTNNRNYTTTMNMTIFNFICLLVAASAVYPTAAAAATATTSTAASQHDTAISSQSNMMMEYGHDNNVNVNTNANDVGGVMDYSNNNDNGSGVRGMDSMNLDGRGGDDAEEVMIGMSEILAVFVIVMFGLCMVASFVVHCWFHYFDPWAPQLDGENDGKTIALDDDDGDYVNDTDMEYGLHNTTTTTITTTNSTQRLNDTYGIDVIDEEEEHHDNEVEEGKSTTAYDTSEIRIDDIEQQFTEEENYHHKDKIEIHGEDEEEIEHSMTYKTYDCDTSVDDVVVEEENQEYPSKQQCQGQLEHVSSVDGTDINEMTDEDDNWVPGCSNDYGIESDDIEQKQQLDQQHLQPMQPDLEESNNEMSIIKIVERPLLDQPQISEVVTNSVSSPSPPSVEEESDAADAAVAWNNDHDRSIVQL